MSNTLAFTLVIIIVGFFALDHFVLQLDAARFLFRKLIDLIQWMAIWR